jgi:hypothetical protein
MPAIHAGMTKVCIFMICGERKLMKDSFEELVARSDRSKGGY